MHEILGERRFIGFLGRHAVFTFGLGMAVPLIPLYYVRVLGVSDAWIGIIGTTQAVLTMAGYFLWRGPARRRGGAWVLIPSTVGCAAFPAALAVTHNELVVGVIVGIYGICLAGIDLALFDELMKSIPADQAVRFASLDQGASNFAGMTGPIVGAVLAAADRDPRRSGGGRGRQPGRCPAVRGDRDLAAAGSPTAGSSRSVAGELKRGGRRASSRVGVHELFGGSSTGLNAGAAFPRAWGRTRNAARADGTSLPASP